MAQQRMQNQQRANQPHGKARKHFAQRVVLQDNPRRTEHARYQDKQAKPPHGVVTEQGAERNQSAYNAAHACHVFAQFPFEVYHDADDQHHERSQDDSSHIPGDIELVHHQQTEDIGNDGEEDRHVALLPFTQFVAGEAVDLAEQENSEGGHQDGEAVDDAQHDELVLQRHDAQI